MNTISQLTEDPRVRIRHPGSPHADGSCVVYWMQRAQRGIDNPALDAAIHAGNILGKPVVVYFAPVPYYPHANLRHYYFLAEGIPDIAAACEKRRVGFVLRHYPAHSLLRFCDEVKPVLVVGDENPLREPEHWRQKAATALRVPFWTVDADVVVPSCLLGKAQYAARVIRPRLNSQLSRFLVRPHNLKARFAWKKPAGLHSLQPDFDFLAEWRIDRSVSHVAKLKGGTSQALKLLRKFVRQKLPNYTRHHGSPEIEGTSRLSPYLHFGHIGPLTVALAVENAAVPRREKDAFFNQLIVWRELAINFVKFNADYDSFESAEPWARRTLAEHARDRHPLLYTERQLENAETHDPLWNAAQIQMVTQGWMHNHMRMYWAKKILEWSRSPEQAFATAVELNDKFELDGRDPNGYAGIAWAIAGKFDRPWPERPIFGKIRYMSLASTGRKFDSRKYIEQQSKTTPAA